jgi:hypothetical protein
MYFNIPEEAKMVNRFFSVMIWMQTGSHLGLKSTKNKMRQESTIINIMFTIKARHLRCLGGRMANVLSPAFKISS